MSRDVGGGGYFAGSRNRDGIHCGRRRSVDVHERFHRMDAYQDGRDEEEGRGEPGNHRAPEDSFVPSVFMTCVHTGMLFVMIMPLISPWYHEGPSRNRGLK